jgi:hypothetical protein
LTGQPDFGAVTLLAVKMRATDNLSQRSSRMINVIATRKLRVWSAAGGWSAPQPTRSIAWAFADACKAEYGAKLADARIDLKTLIAAALREQLGTSHQGIKVAMRWTGAGERTVKNWFAGTHGPSGEHLIALAHHSDAVLEAFLVMASRPSAVATAKLSEVRERLLETVGFIDRLTAKGGADDGVTGHVGR